MTRGESVTEFAIRQWGPGERKGTVVCVGHALVSDLNAALNAHLKARNFEPEEYKFSSLTARYDNPDFRVPANARWLVAFAVEGGSEGYYVHIGAICRNDRGDATEYVSLGFCKTWSPESAYAIAREAQRFLTAADWN